MSEHIEEFETMTRFIKIPNEIVQDATLSYAALGLYVFMASHPEEDFQKRALYRPGTGLIGLHNLNEELKDHDLLEDKNEQKSSPHAREPSPAFRHRP